MGDCRQTIERPIGETFCDLSNTHYDVTSVYIPNSNSLDLVAMINARLNKSHTIRNDPIKCMFIVTLFDEIRLAALIRIKIIPSKVDVCAHMECPNRVSRLDTVKARTSARQDITSG